MNSPTTNRRAPYPDKIDRYEIKGEVGRGASAYVYKAYDPHLDRHLAIKVLRKEIGTDEEYRKAFIREGRLLAKLVHPGIVTIFDVGVINKRLYIVMELLEGFSFAKILKTLGKVKIETLLEMALQLSRALHYAHDLGVIHRDIKPENIIVLIDNKTVKLTDFGIAALNKKMGHSSSTTDKITGTPEYMSPEQIRGQNMDNRSDLYSFGVLLYQLINGHPPFTHSNLGVLFNQIINNKPELDDLKSNIDAPKVADDLLELIKRLLEKEPTKRFQKASDVTIKLQQIQNKLAEDKVIEEPEIEEDIEDVSLTVDDENNSSKKLMIVGGIIFLLVNITLAVLYFVL